MALKVQKLPSQRPLHSRFLSFPPESQAALHQGRQGSESD